MATIREIYDKVNFIKQYLPDEVEHIAVSLGAEILALNTDGQLFLGFDNLGKTIGVYKRLTEELSQGLTGKGYPKNAGEPFNLYASGELFSSVDLRVQNNRIHFFFKREHPFTVRYKDPTSLLGLTDDNQQIMNYEILLPKIQEWVLKSLK